MKTLYPALALGILTAAFIISKTGRDALFFQGKGIFRLPVAAMMITAASLPLAILFVKAMKIWGARPARLGLLLFAGAALTLAAPFLEAGGSPLLFNVFIFIPSSFGIMFASLWLLAADIFETTAKPQAARAFSRIGASSLAGGMLGGFVAKGLSPLIEAKRLILTGALMIFLIGRATTGGCPYKSHSVLHPLRSLRLISESSFYVIFVPFVVTHFVFCCGSGALTLFIVACASARFSPAPRKSPLLSVSATRSSASPTSATIQPTRNRNP